jgi:hypothetical protein
MKLWGLFRECVTKGPSCLMWRKPTSRSRIHFAFLARIWKVSASLSRLSLSSLFRFHFISLGGGRKKLFPSPRELLCCDFPLAASACHAGMAPFWAGVKSKGGGRSEEMSWNLRTRITLCARLLDLIKTREAKKSFSTWRSPGIKKSCCLSWVIEVTMRNYSFFIWASSTFAYSRATLAAITMTFHLKLLLPSQSV